MHTHDHHGLRADAPAIGEGVPAAKWFHRRYVRQDLCISLLGERWFIPSYYRPGDLVNISPAPQADRLLIEDPRGYGPDILAERADPLHSPRCTGCTQCSALNSGSCSTSHGPAQPSQSAHQAPTAEEQRPTRAADSRHSRSADNGPAGCCERSISIHLTLQIQPSCLSRN